MRRRVGRAQAGLALLLLSLVGVGLGADPLLEALRSYARRRAVHELARLERDHGLQLGLQELHVGLGGRLVLFGLSVAPRSGSGPHATLHARRLELRFRPLDLALGRRLPDEVRGQGWTLRLGRGTSAPQPERWLRRWLSSSAAGARPAAPGGASGRRGWPRPPQVYVRDLEVITVGPDGTPLRLSLPLVALRAGRGELDGVLEISPHGATPLPRWLALQGRSSGGQWDLALRAPTETALPGAEAWLGYGVALRGLRADQTGLWVEGLRISARGQASAPPLLRVGELGLQRASGSGSRWRLVARRPELRIETYPQAGPDSDASPARLLGWGGAGAAARRSAARSSIRTGTLAERVAEASVLVSEGTLRWVRHDPSGPPTYATLQGLQLELQPAVSGYGVVGSWRPGDDLGQVAVEGHVGQDGDLRLRVRPHRLSLEALGLSSSLDLDAGRASGDLRLSLLGSRLEVAGHLALEEVGFRWRPVALGRLSGLTSRMDLQARADLTARRVRLESLAATVGDLELSAWGSVARRGGAAPYELTVAMGPVPCRDIPRSLPRGLVPLLEGLELDGHANLRLNARGDLLGDSEPVIRIDGGVEGFGVARDAGPDLARLAGPFVHTAFATDGSPITVSVDPAVPGYTPYRRLGAYLRRAAVAAEDAGFYKHPGLDFGQIEASLERNLKEGRFARGGSTITQQVVKNLFLTREKTLARKLQEAYIAWKLEHYVSKNRILEIYLNIIEWGPGVYGAAAAAKYYFRKRPRNLSLPQAAFLAALISSPLPRARQVRDGTIPPSVLQAMQRIMERMRAMEFITAAELARARNRAPRVIPHPELAPAPEASGRRPPLGPMPPASTLAGARP